MGDWLDDDMEQERAMHILDPQRKAKALYSIEDSVKDLARLTEHTFDEATTHQAWIKDSVLTKMHADGQVLGVLKSIKAILIAILVVAILNLFAH